MERVPGFLKKFSKEESSEDRQRAAEAIKAKRAEYFEQKKERSSEQTDCERILALKDEIVELSTSRLDAFSNYSKLRNLQADLSDKKQELEEVPIEMQEARRMVDDFYAGQAKKWEESAYAKEDIAELFTEEHLASLSLDEYVLLLKRFPREMVTHVTRQGIRDHVGGSFHVAGLDAYQDGFTQLVEDGRLRPTLGIYLVENEKDEAIAKYLHLDDRTRDEAQKALDFLTEERPDEAGSYADKMAVHFAAEEVADCYYGSETGNEIFIAYPSAHIASQYVFRGDLTKAGGGYWNDQWVWANEERGMNLDAGIVFIPKDAKVDTTTGSRYALDENRRPIVREDLRTSLQTLVASDGFSDFARDFISTDRLNLALDKAGREAAIEKELPRFHRALEQDFGLTDSVLRDAVLQSKNLRGLSYGLGVEKGRVGDIDSQIEGVLREEMLWFTEAKKTTTSKEYWETYFKNNPEKKPSKIVYYEGADPTKAFLRWRDQVGIDKQSKRDDHDMGFPENRPSRSTGGHVGNIGIDRFRTLAQKVIDARYGPAEPLATPPDNDHPPKPVSPEDWSL